MPVHPVSAELSSPRKDLESDYHTRQNRIYVWSVFRCGGPLNNLVYLDREHPGNPVIPLGDIRKGFQWTLAKSYAIIIQV